MKKEISGELRTSLNSDSVAGKMAAGHSQLFQDCGGNIRMCGTCECVLTQSLGRKTLSVMTKKLLLPINLGRVRRPSPTFYISTMKTIIYKWRKFKPPANLPTRGKVFLRSLHSMLKETSKRRVKTV